MKYSKYYIFGWLALMAAVSSCKKTEDVIRPTTSVTVYNAMNDQTVLFPDFYQTGKLRFSSILNGIPGPATGVTNNFLEKGLASGTIPISIYAFPDSIRPIMQVTRNYKPAGIYSYFLCGTKTAVDTLFTEDNIPSIPLTDSVLLIRMVNLTKLSFPLSVNVSGKTVPLLGAESLKYKQATPFLKVSVKRKDYTSNNMILQVRNAVTGSLVTSGIFVWRSESSIDSRNYISKPCTLLISTSGSSTVANFTIPLP